MSDPDWKVVDARDDFDLENVTYVYLEGSTDRGEVKEDEKGVWQGDVAGYKSPYYFSKERAIEAVKERILSRTKRRSG